LTDHPELEAEQAYIDHAYLCLEEMRGVLERAGDAGIGEVEAAVLEAWSARRLVTFEDAERGLCFGRLDLDGVLRPLYVGRRWVHEEQTPIVVNWQAPAARPFYTATVAEPQGLTRRRRFRAQGRTLLDLYDEPLDGSAGDIVHGVADILLEELERSRDRHMRDIVATIQTDQYRLITREPEGALVIQGGPGTGKTAVGLHRASWLLYTYRRELERSGVLVVGPNPVFMDYISHVLPMLGEERVEQRAVGELAGVEPARREEPGLARLKGDARLADVIAAAVRALPTPPAELVGVRLEGVDLRLGPEQVGTLIEEARTEAPSHAAGRKRLRTKLARAFYERYATRLGHSAYLSFEDLEASLRRGGFMNRTLDALWPRPKPEQLLRRLLTSPDGLAAAAEGILDAAEQRLLQSGRGRSWSDADLPLLDEARALLEGGDRPHGHVIVDEAQDLTPMQLRMLARRSTGQFTVLGDIAQAAGPIAYRSWDDLLPYLGVEAQIEELRLAYRVPRDVLELALPLLPLIAPDVAAPIAYREGDEPPRFVQVEPEHLVAGAVREAGHEALREGRTALIAPATLIAGLEPLLPGPGTAFDELAAPIQALTPRAAKGLEFDRVVLVEPARIVSEADRIEGLRALYVALTRATKTLVVVHAEALPVELGLGLG
jgi:DNA helicase IV